MGAKAEMEQHGVSKCGKFRLLIPLYIDDELFEERAVLLEHVGQCKLCRDVLEQERQFSLLSRSARPSIAAPKTLRHNVERLLRQKAGQWYISGRTPKSTLQSEQ